ncbi:ABA4-like family protein [Nocardia sp. XZ_19_369]|uniref:ABA4-like family protein n=1 Tax=Nocardia sp. XZ_19_369 TaxID=2769487 RepID=UPI00188F53DB|nr:ABA4-like family protein [Nocardia sp. XZ_19_369]
MTGHLFDLTFLFAAPFWALMILAPRWRRTRSVIASPLICVPPLAVYAILVLPNFATFWSAVTSPELPAVQTLLGSSVGAAAGWAHFIGFDLFLGRWIYLDSRSRGIHSLVISPLLLFTILLAPLGVLAYLLIRSLRAPRPVPELRMET